MDFDLLNLCALVGIGLSNSFFILFCSDFKLTLWIMLVEVLCTTFLVCYISYTEVVY